MAAEPRVDPRTRSTLGGVRRHLAPVLVALASAAVVGLLAFGLLKDDGSGGGAIGSRPPDTALPTLVGSTRKALTAYRGQPVVVNFFASWCGPCKDEAPVLRRFARRGTPIVGVTFNDNTPDAQAFVRRFSLPFEILRDPDESFANALGVHDIPRTFVLDAQGRIVDVRRGPVDEAFLRRALGKA